MRKSCIHPSIESTAVACIVRKRYRNTGFKNWRTVHDGQLGIYCDNDYSIYILQGRHLPKCNFSFRYCIGLQRQVFLALSIVRCCCTVQANQDPTYQSKKSSVRWSMAITNHPHLGISYLFPMHCSIFRWSACATANRNEQIPNSLEVCVGNGCRRPPLSAL